MEPRFATFGRNLRPFFELTVSDTHTPLQRAQALGIKDVSNHSVRLALIETTFGSAGDDPTCILTSVLQQAQALADFGPRIYIWVLQE